MAQQPYVIIVAGGKGERMQSTTPKQFLGVNGRPLLMHTMDLFANALPGAHLILVLPRTQVDHWKNLCEQFGFDRPHQITEGGPTRFHSVKSGLHCVDDTSAIIGIHDAVRPLVAPEVIRQCFTDAEFYGSAVPVVPVTESLRERHGSASNPVRREDFVLVQTPQVFQAERIKKAYLQNYREEFTDDASVLESDGENIHLVPGNPENIKITTPTDLALAALLMKQAPPTAP